MNKIIFFALITLVLSIGIIPSIPFSDAQKSGFNYYLEPQISSHRGICSVEDIAGDWFLIFRGTNYENLNFEITKRVVPGTDIETVC